MFLAWIWEMIGGRVRYDFRSIIIRFILFDCWIWLFFAYGIRLWLLGELD